MRKIFDDRARFVVYMEQSNIIGLTKLAKAEGKTLVEWARETLLGELESEPVKKSGQCVHGVEKGWRCSLCGDVVR